MRHAPVIGLGTHTGTVAAATNVPDRDIAIRGDAKGCDPKRTSVREVMTAEKIKYCFEDEDVEQVAQNMADQQIRRLPVRGIDGP